MISEAEVKSDDEEDEVGGLFKISSKKRRQERNKSSSNELDCSKPLGEPLQDWDVEEVS